MRQNQIRPRRLPGRVLLKTALLKQRIVPGKVAGALVTVTTVKTPLPAC